MELFTWEEIEAIFYAQTIVHLEKIWNCAGIFWLEKNLILELRSAWKISDLSLELAHRQDRWTAIKPVITSMQLIPHLSSNFGCADVPSGVKNHLSKCVDGKRSLKEIAEALDKDPLQIASSYYKWVQEKWVFFQSNADNVPLVLAIDDSAIVLRMIRRTLSSFCNVVVANNAVDGLSIMYHQPVKLLLLDVMMPEIDGLEVCRTIRRMPQFGSLPIIMLTGKDGFFDKMKGRMAGSNEYITKPFEAENLKQVVRRYLSLPSCEVKVEPKPEPLTGQTFQPKVQQNSKQKAMGQTSAMQVAAMQTSIQDQMATRIQYQLSPQ